MSLRACTEAQERTCSYPLQSLNRRGTHFGDLLHKINVVAHPLSQPPLTEVTIINLKIEAPQRLEPTFHKEGQPGFSHMSRVGGDQARKQIEGNLRPYIFLSQLWLPALVSSEFSYSILHLASSVHSFMHYPRRLRCATPIQS